MTAFLTSLRLGHTRRQPVSREERIVRIALMMDTARLADRFYREHTTPAPLGGSDAAR